MSTIAENIRTIRETMAEAARQAGRDPSEIRLCAATKMNDAAAVRAAIEAGVDCCGENRVQEIQEKRPQGAYEGKPLHFIGHLQTNKVKYIVGVVDLIESVDRLELLQCIEKQAAKVGVTQDILLEVNIGNEESKPNSGARMQTASSAFFMNVMRRNSRCVASHSAYQMLILHLPDGMPARIRPSSGPPAAFPCREFSRAAERPGRRSARASKNRGSS